MVPRLRGFVALCEIQVFVLQGLAFLSMNHREVVDKKQQATGLVTL